MGRAEGGKPDLGTRVDVGVVLVDRGPQAQQDQGRIEKRLEDQVEMDPLAEVPSVADVAPDRIVSIRERTLACIDLRRQPVTEPRQVVVPGQDRPDPSTDRLRAIRNVEPEKLREVWPRQIARRQPPEERTWADWVVSPVGLPPALPAHEGGRWGDSWPVELRQPRKVCRGRIGQRIDLVVGEMDVARQRHPAVLEELPHQGRAGKGGRWRLDEEAGVAADQFIGQSCLRAGQSPGPSDGQMVESLGHSRLEDIEVVLVGRPVDLPPGIVREGLAETAEAVGIALLVAIGQVNRDGPLTLPLGRRLAQLPGTRRPILSGTGASTQTRRAPSPNSRGQGRQAGCPTQKAATIPSGNRAILPARSPHVCILFIQWKKLLAGCQKAGYSAGKTGIV